jgi:nicotinamide phosphoribosyltransferase
MSIILNTDSYKASMFNQYPEGTEQVFSYIESRGGEYPETLFFGLQAFLREYLAKPITKVDIDEAEVLLKAHGEPFNRAGWEYILEKHQGYLPLAISAVPEGSIVPTGNVLVTVCNTDPKCFWLTTYVETALLRAVWYPTTVATNSWTSKKIIQRYLEKNGDPAGISFKLHDFGARGVSSEESAGLGGMAHLVNFMGTDTISGIRYAMKYYDASVCGFSIPAMEHSTVTSWGQMKEIDAFRNMLKYHAKPGGLVACVSDSYDIYKACDMWGISLKQRVIDSGATVVIRPDSGDPVEVVPKCAEILAYHFGTTTNSKGYRVLNNVRLIQGDGVDHNTIEKILKVLDNKAFSADNVAFGQGGALLQQVNRDTCKFAMKCSAVKVNGSWRDVYKNPVTDPGKRSKRGIVNLYKTSEGKYISDTYTNISKSAGWSFGSDPVYYNGTLVNETTFDKVRALANKYKI